MSDFPQRDVAPVELDNPTDEVDLAEEQELSSPPESIGHRFFSWQTFVSFGIGIVILFFVFRSLNIDLKDSWRQIRQANPLLFAAAIATYYLSIFVRGWRWRLMLRGVNIDKDPHVHLPNLGGMFEILLLSWFANSAVPARLGDVYRSYLLKKKSNASITISLGTMLAERLIDLVVLVGVLFVSGLIVFGTHAPAKSEQAFLIGGGVVLFGVIGVVVLWLLRERLEHLLPDRISRHYRKVQSGLFQSLANPLPYAAISVFIWLMDGLRLFLVVEALGLDITYQASVMVALISALVSIVPFTPAGLGVVEGFMVKALTEIGIKGSAAAAVALLDRVITYLTIIIVGIPLYIWVVRHDVKEVVHANPD